MDLKSGYPWWAVRNGLMREFPALGEDLCCEVVVLGAGITGALIADELVRHGHEVAVLEQRDVGWGSTAASTALLQYEIDTHLVDLAARYGERQAVLAYRACAEAIPVLGKLAREVGAVDFADMDSLYCASRRRDLDTLAEEFRMRRRHGFDVEWLTPEAVRSGFGVTVPGAILSRQAARIDPYRMAWRLFARMARAGARVFDRSRIEAIRGGPRGVRVRMRSGHEVRAEHLVLAGGYGNQRWLSKSVARNRSSYAFITDPIEPGRLAALRRTMVWETARPYLYLRSTGDHRLLVGGEDDAIDVPARRDARVDAKAARLARRLGRLFPDLDARPAFAWAGTFAETDDGLPFFGPHREHGPRVHFAMAYGGNGITYSMIGAGLVRARIEGRRHPLARLFSFARTGG